MELTRFSNQDQLTDSSENKITTTTNHNIITYYPPQNIIYLRPDTPVDSDEKNQIIEPREARIMKISYSM